MSEESNYEEPLGGWIEWFCGQDNNAFLCQVDEDFIRDCFRMPELQQFRHFKEAFIMILQPEMPGGQDLEDERFLEVYQDAADIYGLIHARFIFSLKGCAMMRERYLQGRFGYCPRAYCEKQHVLPIGLCEDLKVMRAKVFCPRCEEVYMPKKKCAELDGAYFGKSFPQYLLMTFPDIQVKNQLPPDAKVKTDFEPTLFGFRIAGKQGSRIVYKQPVEDIKPLQASQIKVEEPEKKKNNKKKNKENKQAN